MALEGGERSASRPGRSLPRGKTWCPLYRRLGGTQSRSGEVRKISPQPGFDPGTVHPAASRYTDATRYNLSENNDTVLNNTCGSLMNFTGTVRVNCAKSSYFMDAPRIQYCLKASKRYLLVLITCSAAFIRG
jgi:hypothetical protein